MLDRIAILADSAELNDHTLVAASLDHALWLLGDPTAVEEFAFAELAACLDDHADADHDIRMSALQSIVDVSARLDETLQQFDGRMPRARAARINAACMILNQALEDGDDAE